MTLSHDTVAVPGPGTESLGEVIAAAVRACPGVLELNGGGLAAIATYLPGRRVVGVRLDEDRILVGVTLARGASVPQTAQAIRTRLANLADGRPVDVHVADVQDPVPL
jgi:hypothetical protein